MTDGIGPVGGAPVAPKSNALPAPAEYGRPTPTQPTNAAEVDLSLPASSALPSDGVSDDKKAIATRASEASFLAARRASLMSSVVQANIVSALRVGPEAPADSSDFSSGSPPFLSLYSQYGTSLAGSGGITVASQYAPHVPATPTQPGAAAAMFAKLAPVAPPTKTEFDNNGL